jgi:uncharacterized membrane protein YedE/YeeE
MGWGASVRSRLVAFAAGTLFGVGLALSRMTNPAKVQNFLDFLGTWDPSLALVMGGALAVAAVGFPLATRRPRPLFAEAFVLPTRRDLDAELLVGAALFGAGWGLAGFCPGPAIAALLQNLREVYLFVAAMLAGMALHGRLYLPLRARSRGPSQPALRRGRRVE